MRTPESNPPHNLLTRVKYWLRKPQYCANCEGIVLALGGGGARGLAHIGVLQVLEENHIKVRAIAGTSIGAEIGAFIASGISVGKLTEIATEFDWIQTFKLFFPDLPTGGITTGSNIYEFLTRHLGLHQVENLPLPFVAVATNLESGEEVVIDKGNLVDAVRASITMPGIIMPHKINNALLIDGGVVNPVPFDVARQRFGGPVVAVVVNTSAQNGNVQKSSQWQTRLQQLHEHPWIHRSAGLRHWLKDYLDQYNNSTKQKNGWTTRRIINRANEITQNQLLALRTRLNPPDLVLTPDVSDIGPLEFYKAKIAIDAGRAIALQQLSELKKLAKISAKRPA